MSNYFSARVSQEHCNNIRYLALSLGVPSKNIVFKTEGCAFGSMGVYIKFQSKKNLDKFSKGMERLFPCLLEKW